MKNIASNTLSYAGVVTLSKVVGQKKIKVAQVHNTGGESLFEFLADCLAYDFDRARINRPAKIRLLERTTYADESSKDGYSYSYTSASGFIYLLTQPEKIYGEANQCRVRYSFIIPRDYLEGVDSFDNLGIGLYSNSVKTEVESEDLQNFTAFCLLDLNRNTIAETSLAVDWELIIYNAGDEYNL